jgi:integrase
MAIVKDVPALVAKVRGARLQAPAMIALFTGMRLGEILALRWSAVDLNRKCYPGAGGAGGNASIRRSRQAA